MLTRFWLAGVFFALFLCSVAVQAVDPEATDIRILVDISGSMKNTDPHNLRIPAVNLLTELIPEGAQAGVWTFGQYVNRLLPPARVDSSWRQLAKLRTQQINSAGLFTNLTDVLDNASLDLTADTQHEYSIILLTDGYIDMPDGRNDAHRQRLLNQVLPKYIGAGAKIHTLALSDDVDKKLLQEISSATNGLYLEAHSSDELTRVFLKAFDRAVPTEQVPISDNRFNIDGSVTEFTALIFRSASGTTKLISPSGKVYDSSQSQKNEQLRWHHDIGFELLTLKKPEPGTWRVDAEQDPDNRVQILSDLKLKVTGIPETIFSGNPIEMQAMLTEQNAPVKVAEVLRTTEVMLKVTAPDGRVGSKRLSNAEYAPESGIYREKFTRLDSEGEYHFEVIAKGKTFERRQVLVASLVAPLKLRMQEVVAQEKVIVMITPEEDVDLALTRLHLSLTAPDGSSAVHELHHDRTMRTWSYELTAERGPGSYSLEITGRVVLHNKDKMNYRPASIVVNFPLGLNASAPSKANTLTHKEEVAAQTNLIEMPDLAQAYEKQQQELAKAEELAKQDMALNEGGEEEVDIWVYIAIAAMVLLGIAAASFILLRNKKVVTQTKTEGPTKEAEATPVEAEATVIPEDLIQEEIETPVTDEEFVIGDFDAFDDEEEIEIPSSVSNEPEDDLDKDFSIDPENENN